MVKDNVVCIRKDICQHKICISHFSDRKCSSLTDVCFRKWLVFGENFGHLDEVDVCSYSLIFDSLRRQW